MDKADLLKQAEAVLRNNDVGEWTRPSKAVYPHQWLWDSCFSAMGWAHIDMERAEKEILSLLRGQWRNGMMPHIIFEGHHLGGKHLPQIWHSELSPYAPDNVATSGITQPPMLAQAIYYLGEKMDKFHRQQFYKRLLPHLIAYHSWLYQDRDPHDQGLVLLIHPWETGMDNTPPWMKALARQRQTVWIETAKLLRVDKLIDRLGGVIKKPPSGERISSAESMSLYNITRRLKRKHYDNERILAHSNFLIEDVFYNSLLARANQLLQDIAKDVQVDLPNSLHTSMNRTAQGLEQLWNEKAGQYFSRYFISRKPIEEATIATLLPLYSGIISKERAEQLVTLLERTDMFKTNFPVPTVPTSSGYFSPKRYWQGPVWLNTNWLIYDGLKRYGYDEQAGKLQVRSLEMVAKSGFYEYFSPIDGSGAGAKNFSWTAALTIAWLGSPKEAKVIHKSD